MRTPRVGQYQYDRRGRGWKVYKVDFVSENGYSASYTGLYFSDIEEARNYVWKMNGWGTPKSKLN